ncbi:MAG: lamin tail domain-containing protein, partial [Actinomycetales bacterium]
MASPRRAISAFTPEIRSVPVPLSSLSSPARRLAALALLPLAGTALVAAAPTAQAVDIASPVVISEVYGGGGNSGSVYTNDFIELYNSGTTAVDLSGWSVQYASATGPTGTAPRYAFANLSGSVPPKAFYLVQEAKGTGGTTPLPTPDVTGTSAMSGTAGKVALVNNQTALTCTLGCNGLAEVVDFVGFGSTANDFSGSGPTAAPSNSTS